MGKDTARGAAKDKAADTSLPETPWAAPLALSDVPAHGLDLTLEADAMVRAKLAALNNLAGLASVQARLHAERRGRDGLHVTGEVRARATQTCVVSLEPFDVEVAEPVDVEFAPPPAARRDEPKRPPRRGRELPEAPEPEGMDDLDAPDPIIDGKIDLGALAAEFLTLGLDPYPRKPDAAFETPAGLKAESSAFATLAALRGKAVDEGGDTGEG